MRASPELMKSIESLINVILNDFFKPCKCQVKSPEEQPNFNTEYKRYLTVRDINIHYPALKESTIRSLIFNKKMNGFEHCVVKMGRKILIDCDQLEIFIQKHIL